MNELGRHALFEFDSISIAEVQVNYFLQSRKRKWHKKA